MPLKSYVLQYLPCRLGFKDQEEGVHVDMLSQSVITDFAKFTFLPFVVFLQYLVLTCILSFFFMYTYTLVKLLNIKV